MVVAEVPLVPPSRLAALLTARRVERGLDLAAMARRSEGVFSPTYLETIERGRLPLDETVIEQIVDLYEIEAEPVVPSRSKLLLDLDEQQLRVGAESMSFESSTADDVLERYVSLLYLLRGATPGRRLTLRDDDLDVLGESLGYDQERLRDELLAIMAANETVVRTSRLSRRTAVLGAGLLVGATAIGTLVMVAQTPDQSLPSASSAALDGPASLVPVVPRASLSSTEQARLPEDISDSPGLIGAIAEAREAGANPIDLDSGPALTTGAVVTELAETADPESGSSLGGDASTTAADGAAAGDRAVARFAALMGARAEATIPVDFRSLLPEWEFEYAGDSDQWHGVTNSVTKTITVYVEPDATIERIAEVLMHEVGHAIDIEFLDDAARHEWVELRGMPSTWWTGDGLSDFAVGAGDFAEAVAAHAVGSPSQSVYGEFTADQLAFVEAILADA